MSDFGNRDGLSDMRSQLSLLKGKVPGRRRTLTGTGIGTGIGTGTGTGGSEENTGIGSQLEPSANPTRTGGSSGYGGPERTIDPRSGYKAEDGGSYHDIKPIAAAAAEADNNNKGTISSINPAIVLRSRFDVTAPSRGTSHDHSGSDGDLQTKARQFKAALNEEQSSLPSKLLPPPATSNSASMIALAAGTGTVTVPAQSASIVWACQACPDQHECIPINRESRCLCGHRYKEHKPLQNSQSKGKGKGSGSDDSTTASTFPCESKGCKCRHFFFVVAEGAWVLRCRCKHKHIEHDCSTSPFLCLKCKPSSSSSGVSGNGCIGFDSPWVCNCGHAWSSHAQFTLSSQEELLAWRRAQAAASEQLSRHTFYFRQDGLPEEEKEVRHR